jgi:hypothetical protein
MTSGLKTRGTLKRFNLGFALHEELGKLSQYSDQVTGCATGVRIWQGRKLPSSPPRPDVLGGPLSLLSSGYGGSCSGVKAAGA